VVIDTQNNLCRSLVARRAAERLFVSGAAGGRLSQRRAPTPLPEPVAPRLTALIGLASGRELEPRPLPLAHPGAIAAARRCCPWGPTYVAFAPGAGGANKRWPFERFLALAERQAGRGRVPVFLIGPQETDLVAAVRARLPSARLPEVDRPDGYCDVKGPLLVIAMAPRFAAAVANDAGPGHMLGGGRGAPAQSAARSKAGGQIPAGRQATGSARGRGLRASAWLPGGRCGFDGVHHGPTTSGGGGPGARTTVEDPMILIPVSPGELVDKITILRVKAERIDPAKLPNVRRELEALEAVAREQLPDSPELAALSAELQAVNAALWDVEDGKRDGERRQDFGPAFVELARRVYRENDHRAAIKRRINDLLGSEIVEEKSYRAY
jgi:hypothetical protein